LGFVPFVIWGWIVMTRKYSLEMRERALRMLAESRPEHPNLMTAIRHIAGILGIRPETRRL
jgi:transposase